MQPQVAMERGQCEVAHVLEKLGNKIENLGLNTWQLRTLSAVRRCRTAALGGHIDACDNCGKISISYNSCRNRHCPKCQGKNRDDWIQARQSELLPVPYFHVVFTLPDSINSLAMQDPRLMYNILFESAWETIKTFGKKKEVQSGMIAVLHTWGQNLSLHPHLHCIVPGGGVDKNGNWQNIRGDGKFLFPVKALSKVFRAKYCEKLKERSPDNYTKVKKQLWEKQWVVFAKKPFGSPKSVIEYLGRYTHKIAISNNRIQSVDDKNVTFTYKDYRQNGFKKQMTLTHEEFIRRFAMHILPKRFVKIRHYGFLSSNWKREKLKLLQEKLKVKVLEKAEQKPFLPKCPCCKTGNLHRIAVFDQRGPPPEVSGWYLSDSQSSSPCIS
ncbi:Transposase zinc-binding domain-containing protein [Flavobacterium micromati]|uniref:Transposase zinc-binding domain-containing protein n=1 Tax=Flavobacterium micromati TaxID=229205 RepID=A0A1M5R6G6_9FLAO|nr:IS91 family transposase [Flavobacterium micromati]SHH21771.1 Transposase zinc-binding domain-containing protein [Flavobacterium micromati]